MPWLVLLQIAISALQAVGNAAQKEGLADLAGVINAALTKLQEVQDTPVTKSQLESLRG